MIGGGRTYEILFEDCRLPASQLLGEPGRGIGPLQDRLTVRRLEIGARGVGAAVRALAMLCEYANLRSSYGTPLAERQSVQWTVAELTMRIEACRLLVQRAAWCLDRGLRERANTEGRAVKVLGTELATYAIDSAMQICGAMAMTLEHPLQLLAQQIRVLRVLEGPNELQRWFIARRVLELGGTSEEDSMLRA
jgi:alkylation response protein AidB-like acyl-CoA dehydrogenase